MGGLLWLLLYSYRQNDSKSALASSEVTTPVINVKAYSFHLLEAVL
jgi:hypothetical protein